VALSVAGVIEPTVQAAETHRSSQRQTADLTAYDLYLRAWPEVLSRQSGRVMRALTLLDQAIARDPHYPAALALAAQCHHVIDVAGWAGDPAANRRKGLHLARQALEFGADDPVVLTFGGFVLGYFGEDIDAALRLLERALALNPSYAFGWRLGGWLNLFVGRTETAIGHFKTSLRLDPRGRRNQELTGIGVAHFFDRRFEQALEKLLLSLEELPSVITTHRFLAACYAHMGRLREARDAIERLRTRNPGVWPNTVPYRNPAHRELYLSGLRLAFGEEAS
jgi:adenylate cyclase